MIDGTFNLKTSKGSLALKVTKKAIYNFEKERNASLMSFFVSGDPENLKPDWRNLMRTDVQIDLAFYCQNKYSKDDLIEFADDESLLSFISFVIEQYGSQFNVEEMKKAEAKPDPLPRGKHPTETKSVSAS